MSRDREEKRKKKAELARQLGVSKAEADEHKDLAERERVTRPSLQLVERKGGNFLTRLVSSEDYVVAMFLVERRGSRLIGAFELDDVRHDLGKVTYHRPAHFVVVVFPSDSVPASFDALRIDGHEVAHDTLATADWEKPRAARISGVASADIAGAAVSIRGVARVEAKMAFPVAKSTVTIAIEV